MIPSSITIPQLPSAGELGANDLHIWIGNIGRWDSSVDSDSFSADELERAGKLRFEKDRRQFLARRSCVRHVAAMYLDCDPASISVAHGHTGKPYLLCPRDHQFHMSISTTKQLTAFAFASRPVGIDIEQIEPTVDPQLLSRSLNPLEASDVRQNHSDRFTAYWTRKEAYLKWRGIGLNIEPNSLHLPLLANIWQGVWMTFDQCAIASWKIANEHVMSVCVSGGRANVAVYHID